MSNGWRVRAKALPYFGFMQNAFSASGIAPGSGQSNDPSYEMSLTVAIDSLPMQYADAEEIHRLFVYSDIAFSQVTGQPWADLLGIGLTPSGRIVALFPDYNGAQKLLKTASGMVAADGVRRVWTMYHRPVGVVVQGGPDVFGYGGILIDGHEVAATINAGLGFPAPVVAGRFSLFNGFQALTRCGCRVSRATWDDLGFHPEIRSIDWPVDEGGGPVIRAAPVGYQASLNFDLTAQFIPPPSPAPWGEPLAPSELPNAYAWEIETDYVPLGRPETAHEPLAVAAPAYSPLAPPTTIYQEERV